MKLAHTIACSIIIATTGWHATAQSDPSATVPSLKQTLEDVYSNFLRSIEIKDSTLLLSVLPAARIADMKRVFAANGMKFPDEDRPFSANRIE